MSKLYVKLAAINIKNNRQFYLPYLLTGIMSVAMFYLMLAMHDNKGIDSLGGGATNIRLMLAFGTIIVGVFVSIFLFYTNSFLMKRRKKELGLYNILGMEKKHIAKVLFLETLFTLAVTLIGGLMFGMTFNKLLEMFLYRLMRLEVSIPFYVSVSGCINSVKLFAGTYGAAFFYNMMQIKLANPVELLHSKNVGEREPKTKVLMTLIGLATLGAGYYIAITTTDAISALTYFFVAVLLVMVGTYCLFTAGSIALLKLLRKNKKFYYQTKHFTTVSGMIYRMKQNAIGLANICILSTMVLITLSTTVCLYVGVEDGLRSRYPGEISVTSYYNSMPENREELQEIIENSLKASGRVLTGKQSYVNISTTAVREGNTFSITGIGGDTGYDISDVAAITFMTREDYQNFSGEEVVELKGDEVAVVAYPAMDADTVIVDGKEYRVKQDYELLEDDDLAIVSSVCYIIFSQETAFEEMRVHIQENWVNRSIDLSVNHRMIYDIDGTAGEKLKAEAALGTVISEWHASKTGSDSNYQDTYMETRQQSANEFYTLYGGLFFLGIFLGSLFLMVAVLIIFYKQISEGFEDKERFAIMAKVGMSNSEIKRAIRTQVLMVFFLPLVTAIVHVCMAFPMMRKLLAVFNLTNISLFACCIVITALVFGVIYLVVFLLTSRSYYKIVENV